MDRAFAISVDALPLNVRPHSVCPPVVGHRGVQVVVYDQDGSFAPALEPWVERGRATYVPFWPRVMSEGLLETIAVRAGGRPSLCPARILKTL